MTAPTPQPQPAKLSRTMLVLERIKKFVKRPVIQLLCGVVLMVSSASQIVDDVKADRAMHLGAHHGVLLMGLIQILGVLPDFVEALERWLRGWDEKMGLPPIE